ncbi:MAG: zinc ribbon domain-containing protein [Lentisphaerae bacterium]|nr:zinc ribbon domain-containing protein [Lentisphaerota bacterium]
MPTYEYECQKCRHQFELFQSITAKPVTRCPQCHKARVRRLIGRGAGVIFKGSGFYQTDYRSASYRKQSAADKPSTAPGKPGAEGSKPAAKEGTAAAKPAAKTEKPGAAAES